MSFPKGQQAGRPPAGRTDPPATNEVRELLSTIQALRDELDRARIEADARVQQAVNEAHEQARELQQTIEALRRELDDTAQRFRRDLDQREADWHGQLMEARSTVLALRAQLDQRREASHP